MDDRESLYSYETLRNAVNGFNPLRADSQGTAA